jgi:phosphohistidine phosphatase SixA
VAIIAGITCGDNSHPKDLLHLNKKLIGYQPIIIELGGMKKLLISLLVIVSFGCDAQDLTTFVLVRHAEKVSDGSKDPALSPEGVIRAEELLSLFAKAEISAIYSTNYIRTRETVAPLAKLKDKEITIYDWKDPKGMLESILAEHNGGLILISGHSNTTPVLANILLGNDVYAQFEDSDYGNLLIITTPKIGEGSLVHLTY